MSFRARILMMAAGAAVFIAWLAYQPGGRGTATVVSDLGLLTASLLAGRACLLRARHGGRSGRAWLLMGVSVLLWGAGQASFSFSQLVLGQDLPYPSLADVFFMASAAVGIVALFAFPTAPAGWADRARVLLDGLVIAASLVFIAWDAVLEPLIHSTAPDLPSLRWLALAYPLTGIARTTIILLVLARARRGRMALHLLTAGIVVLALTDAVYAFLLNNSAYRTGDPFDAGWLIAFLLIALAASSPGAGENDALPARAPVAVPYLPMVVAGAVIWVALTAEHLHGALLWTGCAVFALVALRQALTHRENVALTRSLEARIATAETSEAELRRSGQRLAEAQRLAHLGSWEIAFGSDRVKGSSGLYDILGLDRETFEPSLANFAERVHPDDRAAMYAAIDGAMETGVAMSVDLRMEVAERGFVWIHARVQAIRSADGTITGVRGTSQDISARRASEDALRAGEERMRSIVDALPVAIIELDTSKVVRVWNPAAEALYKWTREEAEGRPAPFARSDDEGAFDALFRRALSGERIHNVELTRRRKDERTLWVSVSMAPIRDGRGNIVGVTSAGLDVTVQRRLEDKVRQGQKMEAIGRLAGSVAHDFNNLLTVVVAYSEMLLDDLDPASQFGRRVKAMHEAATRAARLTDQLLTFSRRHVVTGEPADLNETVASLRPILKRLVGDDVDLYLRLSRQPLFVAADRMQVQQVLLNLAGNAAEAMSGNGSLTITTSSAAALSGPTTAVLQVADTGVGMDDSTREQIFEPFFTTKSERESTGLGLSTVYGIVRQHGGNVDVSTLPGAGSTFMVSLPLVPSPDAVSAAEPDDRPVSRPTGTVLLVEDEAAVRYLAREILELQGHRVLESADGDEALTIAADHAGQIDVLLTDVVLSGMTGPVIAQRLTAAEPDLQVVFMSGYAEKHLAGVDVGGSHFLAKPFRPAGLTAAVEVALALSRRQSSGSKR